MTTTAGLIVIDLPLDEWRRQVVDRVNTTDRFAGVYCSHRDSTAVVHALLVNATGAQCLRAVVVPDGMGRLTYPSLTPQVPAAFWYERALYDLSDVIAVGHPRLDPLLLPRDPGQSSPRPGQIDMTALNEHAHSRATEQHGPVDVLGRGVFSLPLGPVRSGVFESIEFLIETAGESIPHLNIRPHYKHRGIAKRFENRSIPDGILVAERVEGVSTVAHALAFTHAVEALTEAVPPRRARLIRVVHAELERVANHLDVVVRLCDAAGLAVATARFGWHKEAIMRLVSQLCGSRFGRNVVRAGGVWSPLLVDPAETWRRLGSIAERISVDRRTLMNDSTFLDRVRGTGRLDPDLAASHGALGPVGRGSGCVDDARLRSYDGYGELRDIDVVVDTRGDAQARLQVRFDEIDSAVALIGQACDRLLTLADAPIATEVPDDADGYTIGWAEAAQGEVIYGLEMRSGFIGRCFARSASLHNMLLFHDVFGGDIFTDFPFIEASFGLSYAGVAM
ncbi:NADH-ubiquinone oxidoreductase, chain 49kDa [uncultured Mycobacterium sp.]|uniref:NADH-ubiquinone oxidoreductase, chain 49kDa n=1 Tax=uncultured Mycobacterium sp. TaxID=171292 RepID=A0A1Y5PHE9_9MYCO|nr:NADH-ubiquinone oxidoreductase, chain 49kDa [uncultured Mycobacterium sp.]